MDYPTESLRAAFGIKRCRGFPKHPASRVSETLDRNMSGFNNWKALATLQAAMRLPGAVGGAVAGGVVGGGVNVDDAGVLLIE